MPPLLVLLGEGSESADVLLRLGITYAAQRGPPGQEAHDCADRRDPGGSQAQGGAAGGAAGDPSQPAPLRSSPPRETPIAAQGKARSSSQGQAPPSLTPRVGARRAALLRASKKVAKQMRRLTTQRLELRDRAADTETQKERKGRGHRALAQRLYTARRRMKTIREQLDRCGNSSGQEYSASSSPSASGAGTGTSSAR